MGFFDWCRHNRRGQRHLQTIKIKAHKITSEWSLAAAFALGAPPRVKTLVGGASCSYEKPEVLQDKAEPGMGVNSGISISAQCFLPKISTPKSSMPLSLLHQQVMPRQPLLPKNKPYLTPNTPLSWSQILCPIHIIITNINAHPLQPPRKLSFSLLYYSGQC